MGQGYPNKQIDELNGDAFTGDTIEALIELAKEGKPTTEYELRKRLDNYFMFCKDHDFRPGVETLCLALDCNRTTFWRWSNGELGVTNEWAELCKRARRIISAFLEQISLRGRLNPATSIFLLKNWENYKDTVSFDEVNPEPVEKRRTRAEIAAAHNISIANKSNATDADFDNFRSQKSEV